MTVCTTKRDFHIRDGHIEVCKNKLGFPAVFSGNPGFLIGYCRFFVRHSLSDVGIEIPVGSWIIFTFIPKCFCQNLVLLSVSWIIFHLIFRLAWHILTLASPFPIFASPPCSQIKFLVISMQTRLFSKMQKLSWCCFHCSSGCSSS